jgi:hypothetical protein
MIFCPTVNAAYVVLEKVCYDFCACTAPVSSQFFHGEHIMKKILFITCAATLALGVGCAMFTAWKAVPPPGGCDQCHSIPISSNWTVAYKAVTLADEKDRKSFQTEAYNMPATSKPDSSLSVRKTADEDCFACHRAPTPAHKGRMGKFHHGKF